MVVALLALSVAPVTSLLDVKDVVALATAAVAYRLIAQKRDQQTSLILAVIVGVIVRWVIIGSIGSGDSAFFLDTQILATIGIGLLIASVIRSGSRWFGADAMVITSACMLMASVTYRVASPPGSRWNRGCRGGRVRRHLRLSDPWAVRWIHHIGEP